MPGFSLPRLRYRVHDANGQPLASGKAYMYKAGTSSRQDTASNYAGTLNDNPVVLDATGRAPIFIAQGVGYKVVQKDAKDVTVFTADSIAVPEPEALVVATEIPIGGTVLYGGSSAPTKYLLCDGAAVSRATYATLFALIGTTFGAGNGSTTFNLPNLKQRVPIGKTTSGTAAALAETGGTIDHTHTGPSHTHTIAAHTHTIGHDHSVPRDGWGTGAISTPGVSGRLQVGEDAGSGSDASQYMAQNDVTSGASGSANAGATTMTSDAGGTGATGSANPPFLAVHFIIRATA